MDYFPSPPSPVTDLEIKVSNFLGMKVVHSVQDLLNEAGGLLLTQRLLLGQKVKEFSSGHPARHQQDAWSALRPEARPVATGPEPDPEHPAWQNPSPISGALSSQGLTGLLCCVLPFGSQGQDPS